MLRLNTVVQNYLKGLKYKCPRPKSNQLNKNLSIHRAQESEFFKNLQRTGADSVGPEPLTG